MSSASGWSTSERTVTDSQASVEEFYERTRPKMVRVAVALVSSRTLAEDLVQDAYANSYARFAVLDDPEAYVRRSVVNSVHAARGRAWRPRGGCVLGAR